ncbi:MAG: mechanosensitive ion channel family protein [Halobacteriaceae archaeon]
MSSLPPVPVQTTTTGVDPTAVVDVWPVVVRFGWFLVAASLVVLGGRYVVEPTVSRAIRRRNRNNPTIREAIRRYLRLLTYVVALYAGLGAAGYGQFLGSSALVIAAGTLAVGVAGQTVIGSLVSGLVLVADPEFNVGNYIEWDGGEGEVRSITLRVTRVHTPGGKLITIPNQTLTSEAITRPYGRDRYRVVEHLGLAYGADVEAALDGLTDAARGLDGVLADPRPRAYVDDLGSDAVMVRVHYWVDDPRNRDVFAVRSAFARAAMDALDRADVTVSPPSKRDLQGRVAVDVGAGADGTGGAPADGPPD